MNFRSFIIMIAVGSALLGASVAIRTHSPTQVSSVQSLPPSPQLSARPVTQSIPAPESVPAPKTLLPYEDSTQVGTVSTDELYIVREQLRRAIEQRNPVLLRSLMQASSLRQALATLEVPETVNFDNLDASAWAVLERAIVYRCGSFKERISPNSVGGCFERPSQNLLQ